MPVVTCPKCNKVLNVDQKHIGKTGSCKACGTAFVLQTTEPSDDVAVDPPPSPRTIRSAPLDLIVVIGGAANAFVAIASFFLWIFFDLIFSSPVDRWLSVIALLVVLMNAVLSVITFVLAMRMLIKDGDWRGGVFSVSSFLCFIFNAVIIAILSFGISFAVRLQHMQDGLRTPDRPAVRNPKGR